MARARWKLRSAAIHALCDEHHLSQRHLCVGAFIVQRKRAKRSGFRFAERFDEQVAIGRLRNLRAAPGPRMRRRRTLD